MRIVVTNANEEAKKGYMKKLIQTFIETKMKAFPDREENDAEPQGEPGALRLRYLASLWMVSSVIGIMQHEEIAEHIGISSSLLQSWQEENYFKTLIEYNYQEFLIYTVNLFA